MPMKPYLLTAALVALTAPACLFTTTAMAQGTFTYTYSGDTSPWNVQATLIASDQAVATGLLATNTTSLFITVNGERWGLGLWQEGADPRAFFHMWVDPTTGQPLSSSAMWSGSLQCYSYSSTTWRDELELTWSGTASYVDYYTYSTHTEQIYYPYDLDPGHWSVSYTSVPEPSSAALLALGALVSWVLLRRARVNQSRQPTPGVRLSAYLAPLARRGRAHR